MGQSLRVPDASGRPLEPDPGNAGGGKGGCCISSLRVTDRDTVFILMHASKGSSINPIRELSNGVKTDGTLIKDILAKSLDLQILSLKEISHLIALKDKKLWEDVFETARKIKEKVYGRRIVLFAPLYLSNECVNDCLYCGFRKGNKNARRKSLSIGEAIQEASLLAGKGYKRLLLVTSDHLKHAGADYLEKIMDGIYKNTDIRILHINTAPMRVEDFKRLKASGAGVYQCFQETYHYPTYKLMHPSGPKADYEWRLGVMDRAIEAGFEDIGMGVLLGLYDWRWDVWALMAHCHRLIKKYGFGPHTLSVPRLQPAEGTKLNETRYKVSDNDFKKIIAIYRLALPYVGIVVTTRESSEFRDKLFLPCFAYQMNLCIGDIFKESSSLSNTAEEVIGIINFFSRSKVWLGRLQIE